MYIKIYAKGNILKYFLHDVRLFTPSIIRIALFCKTKIRLRVVRDAVPQIILIPYNILDSIREI